MIRLISYYESKSIYLISRSNRSAPSLKSKHG
ncbi:hypothetical protein T03_16404 [Trichinella britovi]|uniref:Uncharacterized protein n=1 Tax=Trichinella britovi TaxID=45882 RepID=A0A0V1C3T3_TRIBR|nr:hypothetical protein T03_16404 [Trichinella britovi]